MLFRQKRAVLKRTTPIFSENSDHNIYPCSTIHTSELMAQLKFDLLETIFALLGSVETRGTIFRRHFCELENHILLNKK
jgi:hypothetical protein